METRYEFIGVDGSRWPFDSLLCPVRLAETPTGLGGAPFKNQRIANARQAGADWIGRDDEINIIGLKVRLGPMRPGRPARQVFRQWRKALGYADEVGEFHVYMGSEHFWQEVRAEELNQDPAVDLLDDIGWMEEQVKLASDLSWWFAPDVVETFKPSEFVNPKITNEGDVDSFLRYEITGPGKFTIGVGGDAVNLPQISAGQKWLIDTDPENPYIRSGSGADAWQSVGVQRFTKPVPRSSTTPILISSTLTNEATSRVKVTLPQLYRRGTG